MKALVISDRTELTDYVTHLLKEKGFDLIHYRWIIKALDNIEEIQPDVVVLSAEEYPRHWKTLAGFVQSGIGGNEVRVYLCETSRLSVEDAAKADELRVKAFDKEFVKAEAEPEVKTEEPAEETFPDVESIKTASYKNVEVVFNNRFDGLHFSVGKYFDDGLLEINDCQSYLTNVSYLDYISLYDGENVASYSADIEAFDNGTVKLRVKEL